mmetsp:Transcript_846/g.836  ORF Transcript_846/g.836 Transcript_846/m.836 type:complete len:231 (-) Transcript_846:2697-3389(-)
MFKKRTVKKNEGGTVSKPKRKLDIDDFESDSDDGLEKEIKSSSQTIKKRKPMNSTKKPTRDVEHGLSSGNSNALSNPSLDNATTDKSTGEKSVGPIKPPPISIKTTTITDFQPDVCKDFLQTGYCGYGDTCKFLHIRDELKQRKPIEKEWETVGVHLKPDKSKEQAPYRCVICSKDYVLPVKTECNHLFCQKCFMNRYKNLNKPNCFICGKDTGGVCSPVLKKELERLIS